MGEQVYFADSKVRVTQAGVSIGKAQYRLDEITSAAPGTDFRVLLLGLLVYTLGGVLLFNTREVAGWLVSATGLPIDENWLQTVALIVPFLFLIFARPLDIYTVRLRGAFGSANLRVSDNPRYTHKVAAAVNTALSRAPEAEALSPA